MASSNARAMAYDCGVIVSHYFVRICMSYQLMTLRRRSENSDPWGYYYGLLFDDLSFPLEGMAVYIPMFDFASGYAILEILNSLL